MTVATSATVYIDPIECSECGATYGLAREFIESRRGDGNWWFCPSGHRQHFTGKTHAQELGEVRDDLARQRRATSQARAESATERRRHSATKGHLTRTKRRANGGVCLDCGRFFKQVERHRTKMHPEATP